MRISHLSRSNWIERRSFEIIDDGRLPTLTQLAKRCESAQQSDSVLITHVLPGSIEYILTVNSVFPVKAVVAIPYSRNVAAVELLQRKGIRVELPPDIPATFATAVDTCVEVLRAGRPLVVQEVGGYLAERTERLAEFSNFLGVVEDTNNGHWRYERHGPHQCPVLSMAQSPLKDVEDTLIGDAVLFSLERILRQDFAAVTQGLRAGVLGFGKIGTSTATALKGREAVVSIYDINPSKDILARVLGFFPRPLDAILAESQLIIGCTGQTSVRLVDMPNIRDGALLVSASSKNVEFAMADFASHCDVAAVGDVTTRFRQRRGGKTFYVLNEGQPINFRDNSILGTILDLIYSELFVCMREVVGGKALRGLSRSASHIQNEVSRAWLQAHADEFAEATGDKVWNYPESLVLGLPKG